jgi:hypothetical protein
MTIKQRGEGVNFLTCSNSTHHRTCANNRYFRYEKLEDAVLRNVQEFWAAVNLNDNPANESIKRLNGEIAARKVKQGELHEQAEALTTAIAVQNSTAIPKTIIARISGIEADIDALDSEILELERRRKEYASVRERQAGVLGELERLRAQEREADVTARFTIRAKLATALRSVVDTLTFDGVGRHVDVILLGGHKVYRLQNGSLAWTELTVRLGKAKREEVENWIQRQSEWAAEEYSFRIVSEDADGTTLAAEESVALWAKMALHSRA